jgi:hypothetical protein
MDRARCTNEEKRNEYIILVGKPEGKEAIRTTKRMWLDILK